MYMKKIACAALAFGYLMSAFGQSSTPAVSAELAAVRPSPAHLAYQGREIIALVHWGLNPYTGQDWGFGNVPPSVMTAKRLDPAQWAEAMKAAEISCVVLVAKHRDGFCLWPSPLNKDYSMSAVPAPNTGRDLVRELADACRARGMKFGVYLSPWDRHQGCYATPAYVDYFFAQWRDVLDNYGEISEIWLDGANGGTGWYGGVSGDVVAVAPASKKEGLKGRCEYPVLRDTLAGMDLSGAIVSTDALSCQDDTAQTAVIDVQTAGFTLIVR